MKKIKNILAVVTLGGLLVGCSGDYLDTKPTTSMSEEVAGENIKNLRSIVEGMHSMMYLYHFDTMGGEGQQAINSYLDMLGDDVINTQSAYYMAMYRWQSHTDPYGSLPYYVYDYYYTIIQHANDVINAGEKMIADAEAKASLLGEAYAFRAYAYFNLIQCYGKRFVKGAANDSPGVPLRLTLDVKPVARATVAEVYKQIDSDMAKALENLSNAPDLGRKNVIGMAAANGIAARIALTKQEYAQAEQYATAAMAASGAKLQSGAELNDGFNNWSAKEWIWAYHQAADQNRYYYGWFASFAYNFKGYQDFLRFAVRRDLFDKMGENDARRNWWVCKDLDNEVPADAYSAYFNPKNWEWTGQSIKFAVADPQKTVGDQVVMRLAELYYIKAEAQARQGKDAEAEATLNEIMASRDPDYTYSAAKGTLIDEIMRNKRIDLWFEGQRFFDMKRLGILPDRLNSKNIQYYLKTMDGTGYTRAVGRNSGANAAKLATSVDDVTWQFAIPYDEIKATKGVVVQNPLR